MSALPMGPAPARAGAGRLRRRLINRRPLALGCAALALLAGAVAGRAPTRDTPPPGFTGGFGEPTCQECHFEAGVNAGPGTLTLAGVPERYESGVAYRLTLTLVHGKVAVAGFELAARFQESGAQAGRLAAAPAEGTRVGATSVAGIAYAHHLRAGTAPLAGDTARWQLVWTAPRAGGEVVFHAVGNAANDDDSPLGDYVYALLAVSRPALTPRAGRHHGQPQL